MDARESGVVEGGSGAPSPVLAIIDMQRVFSERGSAWFTPRFDEIVAPISRLVDAYRPRVIFTKFVAPKVPQGAWRHYYERFRFALQPPTAPIYELVGDFAGRAGPTVDATTFSKWGSELAARVGHTRRLVLAGVSTECCVLSTALAAADAGVAVSVVRDACAGADDDSHMKALHLLQLYSPLVEVLGLQEALDLTESP